MGCGAFNVIENNEYKNYNHDINSVLNFHNYFREKHNAEKLKFSPKLSQKAQLKLLQLENDIFKYNSQDDDENDNEIGENLFITLEKDGNIIEKACECWYNEKNNYNFNLNKYQNGTGHFTQIIWKKTKEIGSGYLNKNGKIYFLVLYFPIGNELFKFKENIEEEKI